MATEIERKFLVASSEWREHVASQQHLIDGVIAEFNGRKIRVRQYEGYATVTIKSPRLGTIREEFEYEIPIADAERLLTAHCDGNLVEKIRHYVPYQGFTWEIDVYLGKLAGVVIAEVELELENVYLPLPHWVGAEVTDDLNYKQTALMRVAVARLTV